MHFNTINDPAWYNEVDEYAAQWLRNLIAKGLIAPGDVDTRSIEDVHPDDLRGYSQCHFFAGIGGWSLAARLAGIPDDFALWTGSCPCQPFSAAGQGAGFADERHLWPAFHHLIRERRPAVVAGEQVASAAVVPWLDLVQADLEADDYAFGAVPFPAAGIGAPHIRDRTYWMGYAHDTRLEGLRSRLVATAGYRQGAFRSVASASELGRLEYTGGAGGEGGVHRGRCNSTSPFQASDVYEHPSTVSGMADDDLIGFAAAPVAGLRDAEHHAEPCGDLIGLADAHGGECGRIADGEGCQCDGAQAGREQSDGVVAAGGELRFERPGPVNGFWRDADWLLYRDGKWRPVEPVTFPLAHGVPGRGGRLRAYGNAIVPQQAAIFLDEAFGAILTGVRGLDRLSDVDELVG